MYETQFNRKTESEVGNRFSASEKTRRIPEIVSITIEVQELQLYWQIDQLGQTNAPRNKRKTKEESGNCVATATIKANVTLWKLLTTIKQTMRGMH